ncbi:Antibiotic biosynthesis monooxygenase [Actinokineospora alba]|uniref:Antibiotic biosynthesis monooxygenase n=1 Tax=Actinokineospora alba TaxID=504798 RepID=A0A1H0EXQ3_9PSEU|nr:antibiotic biosynthesis monooxygenase [Actinokineospora alba]TDP69262.1 antibiotic biosynthesis monooxygenase [Actinokineospora alba]SDI20748.1 Antibiotic biosynthesis monooxygenase [Actinokineospora alba]SDN87069.1 Antibiotic biosynthesis monooxygenase [Actinokineospora alba]
MFARSTTVQGHPENIDAGIDNIRDQVMPTLRDMEGFVGISLLADRQSGRCIATTAWETEEAMRASEPKLRQLREQAAEVLGARPQVDEWEIAVLHRDHTSQPGACVRATWMRFDADQADRAIQTYKMTALPAMEEFDGFCSASLLMDRESGIAVSSVTYDSPEAMERARTQADALRTASAEEAGVDILEVVEFELALAHLRVPEMA